MPTRNAALSKHRHEQVAPLAQSRHYQKAIDVPGEGAQIVEECERIDELKIEVLDQAARQGWAAVSAGRYVDVADDRLEDFIGQLGSRAAAKAEIALVDSCWPASSGRRNEGA